MNTVKRAWLNFARARPDFMFSLAPHKVVALLQEPLPYEEVKVRTNDAVGINVCSQ